MQYLALLFFFFCMFLQIGASAFNAFAYPFSRHSFIFMPLFAVVTARTLDQIWKQKRLSIPALLVSCGAIIGAHMVAYKEVGQAELRTFVIAMTICALFMAFLVGISRRITGTAARTVLSCLLLAAVVVNVSLEGYYCYNDRNLLTTSDPEYWGGLYNPNVTEALNYLRSIDDSVYRVEKDYYSGSFCMDGMAQNYRGVSAYNSTPNRNLEEFVNLVIPNFPIMAKYEYSYRQIGYYTGHSTLFGIKYLLSRDSDLTLSGYTLLKQFGDIYVYQNSQVSSIARFYTGTGDSAVLENGYGSLDLERMLLETLLLDISPETADTSAGSTADPAAEMTGNEVVNKETLEKKYALEEIPADIPDITGDGTADCITIPLDQNLLKDYERVYLEFDITTPQVTDVTVNQDDPMEYHFRVPADQTKHVQLAIPAAFRSVTLSRYGGSFRGTVSNIRLQGSKAAAAPYDKATVTLTDTGNDSHLTGTVQTEESGFLFLPVPYEEGWTASVDGKEVTILRSDVGFMSIPIEKGDHTFTFTYEQPYLRIGFGISLLSLAVWVLLVILGRRR